MYTKNPVTGRNETLVNTSMLKGALDGVTTKIADKADKGALESLSEYAVGIAEDLDDKADESEVQSLSKYVEGRLPKDVYTPLVDAYVGLACKVADPDVLEGAAKMAYAADPEKYACSNPNDESCAEVTSGNYTTGHPIYDAVSTAGDPVELPPFLRLKSWSHSESVGISTSWKTELPNLTYGTWMFVNTLFTSWTVELPNLTDGQSMFDGAHLTSWTVELPNLTNGSSMFKSALLESFTAELPNLRCGRAMFAVVSTSYESGVTGSLTTFRGTLPSLVDGEGMFQNQSLDLESVRCIAESINDVNGLAEDWDVTKRLDICVGYDIKTTPLHEVYLNAIRDKGWTVTVNGI